MSREKKNFVAQDTSGNAITSATVTVYDVGTTDISTIYSSEVGATQPNPITSDGTTGVFSFFADNATYDVKIVKVGYDTQYRYNVTFDKDEANADEQVAYWSTTLNKFTSSSTLSYDSTTIRLGVGLSSPSSSIHVSDDVPYMTLSNNTEEDIVGGRESKIIFKGEQSGGEESTLALIQASHDGTNDDQKGDLIFSTNEGSDDDTPTEHLRIASTGFTSITGQASVTSGVFPPLEANRITAVTTSVFSAFVVTHTTSGDANSGLGTGINFRFSDSAITDQNLGSLQMVRGSTDTEGIFVVKNGTAGNDEFFRITETGQISTNGELNPDCSPGCLTINAGSVSDTGLLFTIKQSNVSHGGGGVSADDDTFVQWKPLSNNGGGTRQDYITDGSLTSLRTCRINCFQRDTADTTTSIGAIGIMEVSANQHNGANSLSSVASNGNTVVFSTNSVAGQIFKGGGDIMTNTDQTAGLAGTFDEENDIVLVDAVKNLIGGPNNAKKVKVENVKRLNDLGVMQGTFMSNTNMHRLSLGNQGQLFNGLKYLAGLLGISHEELLRATKQYT